MPRVATQLVPRALRPVVATRSSVFRHGTPAIRASRVTATGTGRAVRAVLRAPGRGGTGRPGRGFGGPGATAPARGRSWRPRRSRPRPPPPAGAAASSAAGSARDWPRRLPARPSAAPRDRGPRHAAIAHGVSSLRVTPTPALAAHPDGRPGAHPKRRRPRGGGLGRGCRSAHAARLPRWIHEANSASQMCATEPSRLATRWFRPA
jgi:hypothetical protein